ncbi:MAG: TIGR02302 family protein, partial [Rhizobiaceae bacterium]
PWAIRAFLAVLAFAAFGYSLGPQSAGVADAFFRAPDAREVLSRLDAWVNPPAYTRKPPIFLNDRLAELSGSAISVPQGSELTLRFVGKGEISAQFVGDESSTEILPPEKPASDHPEGSKNVSTGSSQDNNRNGIELSHELNSDGTVIVQSGDVEIAQWQIAVVPDKAPEISYLNPPDRSLSGSLQLSYEVKDDYGIVDAQAEFKSLFETDPDARPLVDPPETKLTLPRRRAKTGSAKVNRDLSSHPWAGSEVTITLVARDDAGQTGKSEMHQMVLPGRRFSNPLALALVEQRRILALDARKAPYVANLLDAVLTAPETFIDNLGAFTAMNIAYRRIVSAPDDDTLRSALDLLWEIALAVEFGDLSDAERRLREAQENLSDALENGASDEEIAELMKELREAMDEFMQMMAEEALRNPMTANPFEQNEMMQTLRQRDLERMMDQIEDLARSGSRDAARQMLSELQRMMDNLRAGRHMQQRQAEGNRMNQALDRLSELMNRQQQLMDETFQLQRQRPQNQQGQQGQRQQQQQGQQQQGQQGENGEMTPEEFAEALRQMQEAQEALRQQLQELGEELEAMGLDPSKEFGEAGREMGEAGENLGEGNTGGATTDQGQALEALRQGAQSMMQQMAGDRQQGGQQPQAGRNGGPDRQRSDPLGRSRQAQGLEDGDETKLPGEIDAQRAREIMEAIRERLAKPSSPLIEKKYLERLLDAE